MSDDAFVTELDLDFKHFQCCGDEDLFPFRCPQCGHIMVFCYECDTLYAELSMQRPVGDHSVVNHFDPNSPIFPCPKCAFEFEYKFMKNPKYLVSIADWRSSGLSRLLRAPSP